MKLTLTLGGLLVASLIVPAAHSQQDSPRSPAYNILYTFTGGADGGYISGGDPILDREGNLYGTTWYGGDVAGGDPADCIVGFGCGVVYKLDKAGHETVLYTFTGGLDGGAPSLGVIRDEEGNLYGSTLRGGSGGAGVVFKLDRSGKETVLYNFTGGNDGGSPYGLLRDEAGDLYGVAYSGGAHGAGVAYKLDHEGRYSVLHTFTGGADGGSPNNLSWDGSGGFVASTYSGGDLSGCYAQGCGVVFRLDRSGKETVLYTFTGGADGGTPGTNVIPDEVGNLYGAAGGGGGISSCNGFGSGCGVVFKLDRSGKETVLHAFTGGPSDGWGPFADLIRDRDGNIYSTTYYGGAGECVANLGCGVVFKLDRTGKETILHYFPSQAKGTNPLGLVQDWSGDLYGIASLGGDVANPGCGDFGCGLVYKLSQPCDHHDAELNK